MNKKHQIAAQFKATPAVWNHFLIFPNNNHLITMKMQLVCCMCHVTAYTVAPPAGPWEQCINFSKCHNEQAPMNSLVLMDTQGATYELHVHTFYNLVRQ